MKLSVHYHLLRHLLMLVLPFALFSCSTKDDDAVQELDKSISNPNATVLVKAPLTQYNLLPVSLYYDYLKDYNYESTFSSNNSKTGVYVKQDGKFIHCGSCPSTVSSDQETLTVQYNQKQLVNTSKSHTVYTGNFTLRDNDLYYSSELTRTNQWHILSKGVVTSSGTKIAGEASGVLEEVFISNKTDKPITFKHKGFDVKERWYYEKAEISISNHSVVNGTQVTTDRYSNVVTVPISSDGSWTYITSVYPPTGKKIKEATLIAEIDGKEVRTVNKLSSDLALVPGQVYCYVVEWDGTELRFAQDIVLDASISDPSLAVVLSAVKTKYEPLIQTEAYDVNNQFLYGEFNKTNNDTERVWARQDGRWIYCGDCSATLSDDQTMKTVKYNENRRIDTTKPYELFCGYFTFINGVPYYTSSLLRTNSWNHVAKGSFFTTRTPGAEAHDIVTLQEEVNGVYEGMYVINKSDKTIEFRHKGFDVKDRWYYGTARISVLDNTVIGGVAVSVDSCSDIKTVEPRVERESRSFGSRYAPTGKKIKNATLIAEIDGKEVRTSNTLSSDLTLVPGKAYCYVVEWDGKELRFVEDEPNSSTRAAGRGLYRELVIDPRDLPTEEILPQIDRYMH